MIRRCLNVWLGVLIMATGFILPAGASTSNGEIPPELARWRSWVLHGQEEKLCPSAYDKGDLVRCQWPSRLNISVKGDGGLFEQRWLIFARGWVYLPGNLDMWPDGVVVDGKPAAVVNRYSLPAVRLTPGEHHIKGRFYWQRMPEMMRVQSSIGLLSLTVDGQKIKSPVIDKLGWLWLKERGTQAGGQDQIKVRVFRMIDDTVPMRITTRLRLNISGQNREIRLKKVLVKDAVPMDLESRLPVRLDADGRLLIQARPGNWDVRIVARMPNLVNKIDMGETPYGDEVWSFKPRHHLRMVEIEGIPQVEPGQTEMPDQWRGLSAYLIKPGATMNFKQIRRGDPDPVPDQLRLHRQWWLDFNGKGFTLHDTIEGTLSRQWYMAIDEPVMLGRISVNEKDQVITAQGDKKKAGVELRQGALNLKSDARLPKGAGSIRAVGWDHDFQKVTGELYLPPGWRLMGVTGVDQVSDTWLKSWSLYDFFLVLIIALAVFKLRGWRWGVLALFTMMLLYPEPGAPRIIWLHVLAVLALLPLLPDNWVKRVLFLWGVGSVTVLLVIAIPFMVKQVRWGFYPQLTQDTSYAGYHLSLPGTSSKASVVMDSTVESAPKSRRRSSANVEELKSKQLKAKVAVQMESQQRQAVWHQDPDALIPTGPGLPDWHWQTIRLNWNGPVSKDQTIRFFLWSPIINLVVALLRVALLSLLIWGLFDWKTWWQKAQGRFNHVKAVIIALVVLFSGMQGTTAHAAGQGEFPPSQMLEDLKKRLLEPPDCLPYCADISRLEVAVSNDEMRVILKVHAAEQISIPLPVNRKSWTPEQILLDNAPISGLARDKSGGLWAVVPPGLHTIVMLGSVSRENIIQIPLPLKPHIGSYVAKGWVVKGILPNGTVGSSIQLTRIQDKTLTGSSVNNNGALPSFLHVRRVLYLGLTWQVGTTIERVTPIGTPVVVNLPLLENESVTTPGLYVEKGHLLINMSADQRQIRFTSDLKINPDIKLAAPRAVPWTESWVLDASPVWHCDLEGIPVIHHQDHGGQWKPQWKPWPGETVTIKVHRPKALEGQILTIQNAEMTISPGQRYSRGELAIRINASRGGQHSIELPPKTNLQKVQIKGKSLPVRQDGQWITLPLQPGIQNISLQWHQLAPFSVLYKAPPVKIGKEAVNARVSIKMPQKRWILLTGGPQWGPAVLFWSYLAVIVLVAVGLGRLTITPLKSWQWILLGLGLTQIPAPMVIIIIGWLLSLGLREKLTMPKHWLSFNMLQIGLVFLSFLALISLFFAVKSGLIGHPDMQIDGNGSSSWVLNWTQDRIDGSMPRPWVLSLPVWTYRVLMLAWSLWLAYALLGWFKWAWGSYSKDGAWKKIRKANKPGPQIKPQQPQEQ